MIEFLQDYTTKSLPPEVFEAEQQVERSPESELYFVRLGVAGYVTDDGLVGEDYQPIVRETVAVVVTNDRRFADGGRAGEVIGLAASQRASSGPGNEVVFAGQPDSLGLSAVEIEQLRGDLAASIAQLDEHRDLTTRQIDELTVNLTTAQGDRETALADLATAHTARDAAVADLSAAQSERDQARAELLDVGERLSTATGRIAELERQLETATAKRGK